MIESAPGYTSWNVHIHKESYLDIFEKENLVYLTSESDQVMTGKKLINVHTLHIVKIHSRVGLDKGLHHRRSRGS